MVTFLFSQSLSVDKVNNSTKAKVKASSKDDGHDDSNHENVGRQKGAKSRGGYQRDNEYQMAGASDKGQDKPAGAFDFLFHNIV